MVEDCPYPRTSQMGNYISKTPRRTIRASTRASPRIFWAFNGIVFLSLSTVALTFDRLLGWASIMILSV